MKLTTSEITIPYNLVEGFTSIEFSSSCYFKIDSFRIYNQVNCLDGSEYSNGKFNCIVNPGQNFIDGFNILYIGDSHIGNFWICPPLSRKLKFDFVSENCPGNGCQLAIKFYDYYYNVEDIKSLTV